MIETLSLRNFKVLRSVNVRLRPLTLIVGPNGSGKSSLLEALAFSMRTLAKAPRLAYQQLDEFKSRLPLGPVQVAILGEDRALQYSLTLVEGKPPLHHGAPVDCSLVTLSLDVKRLAAPSPAREIVETLPADGSGLASILAGLHLEEHGRFNEIVDRLRTVVPTIQGLRIKKAALESREAGYEILFDMAGGEGIPAHHVSEGTLVTLALLVLLAGPNPPGLVLIENLERGLHPKALQALVRQIRSLQEQNPQLQIVATSHSPYLLDFVEADEILLTSLDENGYASVRALSEHPEYDRWKDVMAPGEFWSTVGESWVVQKT